MSWVVMIVIAVGLAMDAFAVSIASGVIIRRNRVRHALAFGISFGMFQMIMPVVGWLAGMRFQRLIVGVDHWVAFTLLAVIGGKMIYEAFQIDSFEQSPERISVRLLLLLSIATSIDALAVGLSFAFLKVEIIIPVLVIGAVTFGLSFFGFILGNRFGRLFEQRVQIAGGLMLIGIGLKILFEHLF